MNICTNFHADIFMLNIILKLANFGPENWSRVPGIGLGFYSFLVEWLVDLGNRKKNSP